MSSFQTECLATPGYAGFVPNIKYQFGQSYGNATRHILQTDKTLKKQAKKDDNAEQPQSTNTKAQFITPDDHFSLPAVPGYTGYIPRSQETFGKSYVETVKNAMNDFGRQRKQNVVSTRVRQLQKNAKERVHNGNHVQVNVAAPKKADTNERVTFVSGYTGYIPQLKNHFGKSVPRTLADGDVVYGEVPRATATSPSKPYFLAPPDVQESAQAKPIPGFTGHIPGSKYRFATTYGKLPFETPVGRSLRDKDDHHQDKFLKAIDVTGSYAKDLTRRHPIPGYMGHLPGLVFTMEHSYGQNAKSCLKHQN